MVWIDYGVGDMKDSWSWAIGFRCYKEFQVVLDRNDSKSWALAFRCNEQLIIVDGMSYSGSWAHGFRCYEWLEYLHGVNDSIYHDLWPLDAMSSSRLLIMWTILGLKPMTPNSMNNSRVCMIGTTPCCDLRALDVINSSKLWLTWTNSGHELWDLDAMKISRS